MGRKANKKNKSKQQKFRDAKKKMHRVKLQEVTRIPNKQANRWATGPFLMTPDQVETEYDPDYVAFCISHPVSDEGKGTSDELSVLWLRIAAAMRLGMYTLKSIDRTGKCRPFDAAIFSESISDKDYEHEVGLRYEADKFLCYLIYGADPRFREMFGYVLLPSISTYSPVDLNRVEYSKWFAVSPTSDLAKQLAEFDFAKVE